MDASFSLVPAGEKDQDRDRDGGIIRRHPNPGPRAFVGVIDPIDPRVETPDEARNRVLEAARDFPADRHGTCGHRGSSPCRGDATTARDPALATIRARAPGPPLASKAPGAA